MTGLIETTRPGGDDLSNAERKLTKALALASRMLSQGGHDDLNQGQVSARLPGSDEFFVKSALLGFNEARPTDMLRVHVDARETPPALAPPELPLHQAVYAARPDVNAIVHSHAPYSLVFGATDWEIRPLSHDGAYFAGRVPRFTETTNTVLDVATGEAIVAVLGDCPAAFLRNHGLLVVGKTVPECFLRLYRLERACEVQIAAAAAGTLNIVSRQVADRSAADLDSYQEMQPAAEGEIEYAALMRKLDKIDDSYRR
jgi:L-fuculose-phosphate aldolase